MRDAAPESQRDPTIRRALELDALAAILPIDRRDRLAELLTDDDIATLKYLAKEGMGDNSLRALASDLAYLEAWTVAATRQSLPWPGPEALALKFVAHHLCDPRRQETDAAHGMPAPVAAALSAKQLLRVAGPTRPRQRADACQIGLRCIIGGERLALFSHQHCAQHRDFQFGLDLGHGSERASMRSRGTSSIGFLTLVLPTD